MKPISEAIARLIDRTSLFEVGQLVIALGLIVIAINMSR